MGTAGASLTIQTVLHASGGLGWLVQSKTVVFRILRSDPTVYTVAALLHTCTASDCLWRFRAEIELRHLQTCYGPNQTTQRWEQILCCW